MEQRSDLPSVAATHAVGGDRITTVGLLLESATGLRRVFQRRIEGDGPISSQSFDVLIRLARSPGCELRMSELAAQTSLTPSGLTRSVDRLQNQGLVARRVCPEDRRGAFAVLTAAGRDLMDEAIPSHVTHIDEVFAGLYTAEEEAALAALVRRLRDHLFDLNSEWCPTADEADECPSTGGMPVEGADASVQ